MRRLQHGHTEAVHHTITTTLVHPRPAHFGVSLSRAVACAGLAGKSLRIAMALVAAVYATLAVPMASSFFSLDSVRVAVASAIAASHPAP